MGQMQHGVEFGDQANVPRLPVIQADRTAVRVDRRRADLEPRIGSIPATMPESARVDVPTIVGDAWPRGPSRRVSLLCPRLGSAGGSHPRVRSSAIQTPGTSISPRQWSACNPNCHDLPSHRRTRGRKLRRIRGAGDARLGASARRSERCRSGRGRSAPPETGADRRVAAPTRHLYRDDRRRPEKALVGVTVKAVGSLAMIGLQPDKSVSRWLRSIDKAHIFDGVNQIELAATVEARDLGNIPHRDQAGIRAMSPLKLYEYVAAGLPVLAVDHPPMRGVADDRVRLCHPEHGRPVGGPRDGARSGRREAAIHPRGGMGTAPATGGRRGRPRPSDPRAREAAVRQRGSHTTLVILLGVAKAEASVPPDESVASA
jgi:hypothetical protein